MGIDRAGRVRIDGAEVQRQRADRLRLRAGIRRAMVALGQGRVPDAGITLRLALEEPMPARKNGKGAHPMTPEETERWIESSVRCPGCGAHVARFALDEEYAEYGCGGAQFGGEWTVPCPSRRSR